MALKPQSVLDIGTGFGKYGVLCREYLELWDGRDRYDFLRRIDGVEAYGNYITPLHKFIYNNLYIDDILKVIDKLDFSYDLVLLIDVLEHFNKSDGKLLVGRILDKNRGILISTPKIVSNQQADFSNSYEMHKSQWTRQELASMGYSFFTNHNSSFILYLGKKEDTDILNRSGQNSKKAFGKYIKKTKRNLASIPFVYRAYKFIKR